MFVMKQLKLNPKENIFKVLHRTSLEKVYE